MNPDPEQHSAGALSAEVACSADRLSNAAKEALLWLMTSHHAGTMPTWRALKTVAIVWGDSVLAELKAHGAQPNAIAQRPADEN